MQRSGRMAIRRALTGALLCGLFPLAAASGGEGQPPLALDLQVAQMGSGANPGALGAGGHGALHEGEHRARLER